MTHTPEAVHLAFIGICPEFIDLSFATLCLLVLVAVGCADRAAAKNRTTP